MSNETKVRTTTIDGRPFDIFVNENGVFYTYLRIDGDYNGDYNLTTVKGKTLKDVEQKLKLKLRVAGVRLKIPVTLITIEDHWRHAGRDDVDPEERLKIRTGTLTGIHASNHNALIRFDDAPGELEQNSDDGYDSERLMRRLTPADVTRMRALFRAKLKAEKDWQQYLTKHAVKAKELVAEHLAAAEDLAEFRMELTQLDRRAQKQKAKP